MQAAVDSALRSLAARVRTRSRQLLTLARMRRKRKRLLRAFWRVYDGRRSGTYPTTLTDVATRDQIPELLNRRGLVATGIEIGVKRAGYSEFVLAHWRGQLLISVDPWSEAPSDEYRDRANVAQAEQERYYRTARTRLARFGGRSEIWRTTSVEAAARVADASLDFVYIDARHDRESVLEDIAAWYPKVRPGGIVAGHDYVDGDLPQGHFEVASAVDAYFGERGLPVYVTRGGPSTVEIYPSWIVAVPVL